MAFSMIAEVGSKDFRGCWYLSSPIQESEEVTLVCCPRSCGHCCRDIIGNLGREVGICVKGCW